MDNLCRLCANVKSPQQLVCSIDDQTLNIEQKLIDCCRWKQLDSFESYGLPRQICNICLKNLEKCWLFAENVTRVQQELIAQCVDVKPTILLQIESINTPEFNESHPEIIEDIKISFSPQERLHHYEDNFPETIPEPLMSGDEREDLNDTLPQEQLPEPNDQCNETKQNFKNGEINGDLLTLLSNDAKNSNGTISMEKISELNLNDWSIIQSRCSVCKEVFENHRQLKGHFDASHPNKTQRMLCPFCNSTFSNVYRHVIKSHRSYLEYCCKKCNTFYWDLTALKIVHNCANFKPEINLLCEICGKSFTNKSKLNNHTRLHLPVEQRRSFECYICKTTFAYKKSLVHHIRMHWGQKIQYQCNICLSNFSRTDALRRHSLIHLGQQPHQCQYCGKGFRTKFNLKTHERIHTGERPYRCTFCDYRSTDAPNLKKHIKQRHRTKT